METIRLQTRLMQELKCSTCIDSHICERDRSNYCSEGEQLAKLLTDLVSIAVGTFYLAETYAPSRAFKIYNDEKAALYFAQLSDKYAVYKCVLTGYKIPKVEVVYKGGTL